MLGQDALLLNSVQTWLRPGLKDSFARRWRNAQYSQSNSMHQNNKILLEFVFIQDQSECLRRWHQAAFLQAERVGAM